MFVSELKVKLLFTDFCFRKERAFSMLLRCWNIPLPLSRLCKTQSRQSLGWFVELSAVKLDVQSRTERRLTTRWPLITSSRSNSLEPSRKSLNRSMTMQGGLRCHSTQTQTQTHFMLLSLIYVSKSMERFVLNVFLTEFCEASAEGRPPCDTESKLIS